MKFNTLWLGLILFSLATQPLPAAFTVSGNAYFEKIIYTRPDTLLVEQTTTRPCRSVAVVAYDNSGVILANTTSDDSGNYALTIDASSATIHVESVSDTISVGRVLSGIAVTQNFSVEIPGAISTNTISHNITISVAQNSGAFNIHDQLRRARLWMSSLSYTTTRVFKTVWPSSATFYDPDDDTMRILSSSGDSDEFDDDIILHEFGHLLADIISRDDSLGGSHYLTDRLDLRLSWSEGLAHYLSSAVRDDSYHVDSTGSVKSNGQSTTSSWDIASSSQGGSHNEWAVANALWDASQTHSQGHASILAILASFKNLPAAILDDPVSLDTFHDLWLSANPDTSLTTIYQSLSMSYFDDDIESLSTQTNPYPLTAPTTSDINLTFFPSVDSDYFVVNFPAGSYTIYTDSSMNGALCGIRIYTTDFGQLLIDNSPANFSDPSHLEPFNTNASIDASISEGKSYGLEVYRFRSSTENFGPSKNSLDKNPTDITQYTKTVGRYGSLHLVIEKTSTTSSSTSTFISSSSSTGGTSGGGGGGCFLH